MQDYSISIAITLEILQSCTKPSICSTKYEYTLYMAVFCNLAPLHFNHVRRVFFGGTFAIVLCFKCQWSNPAECNKPHEFCENDNTTGTTKHDDVIRWKHFPRFWPFVRGIHRSPTEICASFMGYTVSDVDIKVNKIMRRINVSNSV